MWITREMAEAGDKDVRGRGDKRQFTYLAASSGAAARAPPRDAGCDGGRERADGIEAVVSRIRTVWAVCGGCFGARCARGENRFGARYARGLSALGCDR